MSPSLLAVAPVSPGVGLVVFGIVAALAVGFLIFSQISSQPAAAPLLGGSSNSFFSHLKGCHQAPEMQLIGRALASRLRDFGEATGHSLLDGFILKVLPVFAPFIPAVNRGASALENKLAGVPIPESAAPATPIVTQAHQKFVQAQQLLTEAEKLLSDLSLAATK